MEMENQLCAWSGTHVFYQGKCRRCNHPQPHNLGVWARTGMDLGLSVINMPGPDGKIIEIVIFNQADLDRGWVWIKPYSLFACQAGEKLGEVDPGGAVAILNRLRK